MNNGTERILLYLYFPQFKSQNCSRFETFFKSIQNNEASLNKNNHHKSKIIYPEKIVRNEDKRTSLLIKGIPSDISKKEVRNLFEKYGNINYLYLTKNTNDEENESIAYLNVINYKTIVPLFMNLRNFHFLSNGKLYNLKIMYSTAQGKKQLKNYIKKLNFCKYLDQVHLIV